MGRNHYGWLSAVPGLRPVAMCDIDPARVETARRECPDLELYTTRPEEMLADGDLDLVVVILPHSLHEKAALECLDAGKHVVIEKPFCITVEEANRIARRARESKLAVSVFHNRRWDPDYLTIRDVIDRGLIGEVFHVECHHGGYGHPGLSWRSDKAVSGGVLYDWGAHFLDWILNLVPAKIAQVTGTRHDRVWHGVTNEDYMKVGLRFENGVTAEFVSSRISALPQPKWRILGTLGGLEAGTTRDELRLVSYASGVRHEGVVPVSPRMESQISYYRQLADHLLLGEPNPVTPEQARRVIGIIQAAELSAERGAGIPPLDGCE